MRNENVRRKLYQGFGMACYAASIRGSPPVLESDIDALVPAELGKTLTKCCETLLNVAVALGHRHEQGDSPRSIGLPERNERIRQWCSAKKGDKSAPPHC